jgi:serine/threonine protein kinase
MKPEIGSQLGNYKLLSPLGAGGFALVYLGEHIYLQTKAAIKVLHFGPNLGSTELEQFLKEARTIAQLRHPNIVGILEFGVEDDVPYLVMEYAPNGSLRSKHPRGSVLSISTVVSYVQQIASALQYAHENNVVHCDVKPENMLLSQDNEVLLSDFGIARAVQNSVSTQDAVGTIHYMAPEQFAGKPIPASDQYALGVVVYQWLSGQLPFNGNNVAEMFFLHTYSEPPVLREIMHVIPPDIEEVVSRALAKNPNQRFPDVQAFANALEEASTPTELRNFPALTYYSSALEDAISSEEPVPLLPVTISSFLPLGSSSVEDNAFAGQDEPQIFFQQKMMSAEPPEQSLQGQAMQSSADSASIPLLPRPSILLPQVETPQEHIAQEQIVSPSEEEPDASLQLPSISWLLSSERMQEEEIPATIISPESPSPTALIDLPPSSPLLETKILPQAIESVSEPPKLQDLPSSRKIKVFISYSHHDRSYRTKLDDYLKNLERNYPTASWHDGEISPGIDFAKEIEKNLREAHLILLLVSQNFIASDYCHDKEMKEAMARHEAQEARVIPIILQPAQWKGDDTPFGKLQALPRDGKPITKWSNKADAYLNIADGIKQAIIDMLNRS